jgi:hypothetical protein
VGFSVTPYDWLQPVVPMAKRPFPLGTNGLAIPNTPDSPKFGYWQAIKQGDAERTKALC